MKFELPRDTLLKPLQQVIGVIGRKQLDPMLAHVLLDITSEQLSITATDLDIELISRSPLEVPIDQIYRLTLPGRKLVDICRAIPEESHITVHPEKERITLRAGSSRFTLSTLPAEHFPNTLAAKSPQRLTIPAPPFLQLLQRTAFAMAQEDVRFYFNGMRLEIKDNTLSTVASDGHRFAKNSMPVDWPEGQPPIGIIIPYKAVQELSRIISDHPEPLDIFIEGPSIRVVGQTFTCTAKLIKGQFPDYSHIIPRLTQTPAMIDRDKLKHALLRTAVLCYEKSKGVRLEFSQNRLHLSNHTPEHEIAEEELSIEYTGETLTFAFNVRYLLDILQHMNAGDIQFSLSDPSSSVLIQEKDAAYNGLFIVMPMRLYD